MALPFYWIPAVNYTDSEDILGYYRLPVEPNQSYNIVAFSKDYTPQCAYLVADMGQDYSQNFSLTESGYRKILLDMCLSCLISEAFVNRS